MNLVAFRHVHSALHTLQLVLDLPSLLDIDMTTLAAPPISSSFHSIFRPSLFAGQTIIITGGGSGIGRSLAHELAALGANLALFGRKIEKLQVVQQELAQANSKISIHVCDIREEETVTQAVAAVLAEHGRIDGLVNNAGGQFPAPLKDISRKGWDAVVNTNLTGGFLMARACLVQWMEKNGGAIVNVTADFIGSMPGMGHSGAARAGMQSFTETAALEWAQYGVRVNAIAPGYVASSGMDAYPEAMLPVLKAAVKGVPLQRMANEAEISSAIVFLLSPAASFITGTCLRVDGGRPQMRAGWFAAPAGKSAAVAPFDGFSAGSQPRILDL